MPAAEVLVLGAGPAGMAAAAELARLGLSTLLVEQRDRMGGAIYRQFAGAGNSPIIMTGDHRRRRDDLMRGVAEAGPRITPMLNCVLVGVDRDGRFLLDDRRRGVLVGVQPRAAILALGTVEQVMPRDGWELPGVVTAGGMQVQLKETGEAPRGSILLAGNGPLLPALAAQLVAAGNPPVAVLERAQPVAAALRHGGAAVQALRCWPNVQEALTYAGRMLRARVPYRCGWTVLSVQTTELGLLVSSQHRSGKYQQYLVDHLALHDGLQPNITGLPDAGDVMRAGDCREVLGVRAAVLDGRQAAHALARRLGQPVPDLRLNEAIARLRQVQHAMARLFQAPSITPTATTVICRCEGLRRVDFDNLQLADSAREVRLVGRFGMGACQGRFCAHAVSALARQRNLEISASDLHGDVLRWPLRPVSLAAMASYADLEDCS